MIGIAAGGQSCGDDDVSKKPVAITTSAEAVVLAQRVIAVVNGLVADVPNNTTLTIEDETATGSGGGSVTMNGAARYSKSSSSSSTLESYSLDVTMVFSAFKTDGLTLEGPLRYGEYYSYRFACSASGCASSTHASQNYGSTFLGETGSEERYITVEFESEGVRYRDVVLLDIEDSGGSSVLVRLTNEAGEEFITYI